MNQKKVGSFLKELRKEKGITQEQFAEKLNVSGRSISRWETGNYMPPVEMLEMLSNLYGLTINELLSGQKLTTEEYKEMAEENIKETLNASTFELQEKIDYFKRKWRKEHIVAFVFLGVMWACVLVLITLNGLWWPMVISLGMLLAVLLYMILNNMMMAYVEDHVYGGKWNKYESKKE